MNRGAGRPKAPEDDDPKRQRTTKDDDLGTGGRTRTLCTEEPLSSENKGPEAPEDDPRHLSEDHDPRHHRITEDDD